MLEIPKVSVRESKTMEVRHQVHSDGDCIYPPIEQLQPATSYWMIGRSQVFLQGARVHRPRLSPFHHQSRVATTMSA